MTTPRLAQIESTARGHYSKAQMKTALYDLLAAYEVLKNEHHALKRHCRLITDILDKRRAQLRALSQGPD